MRITALIAAAICCAGCPTLSSGGVTAIQAAGTYVHAPSGFVFPETFAEFHRASVLQYDSAGDDIGVGYNVEEPDLQIALTLYVFPPRAKKLEEQFELERDEVVQYHAGAQASHAQSTSVPQEAGSVPGLFTDFRYRDVFARQDQLVSSLLYLFAHEGWSVKYRITYPLSQEPRAKAVAQSFVASFPWKGGT